MGYKANKKATAIWASSVNTFSVSWLFGDSQIQIRRCSINKTPTEVSFCGSVKFFKGKYFLEHLRIPVSD